MYTILTSLVGRFEDKLQSFKKKFEKWGQGDILTYTKSESRFDGNVRSSTYRHYVTDIEVKGHYQVAGYEFVASLEWLDDQQSNLVLKAPNTPDIPTEYVTRSECDHCKTHRYRKYTVLLRNTESGEYVQVGKACVKDYLGCDIGQYASYLDFLSGLDDMVDNLREKHGGNDIPCFPATEILEQACAETRVRGYKSKAQVNKWYEDNNYCEDDCDAHCPFASTTSIVYDILMEVTTNQITKQPDYPRHKVEDVDREMVSTVVEWVCAHKEDSDYNRNLYYLATSKEAIDANRIGLLVSAVGAYLRDTTKKETLAKVAEESKSEYVGEIGQPITFTATPHCVFKTESLYGMFFVYEFKVGENVIVWKTSKLLSEDTPITLKGKVKDQVTYHGIKQTEVKNCKKVG